MANVFRVSTPNVTDPTQIREAIAYQVYRDAGVPASRTAFSRVFLTIRGQCKDEYLGMYTIIAGASIAFLIRPIVKAKGYTPSGG